MGAIVRQMKNEELMAAGVTLIDPATTYVQPDVVVGRDTVIHPNVYLEGRTVIGEACEIHAGARIVDSTIGNRVTIRNYCIVTESTLADETDHRSVRAPAAGQRREGRARTSATSSS